MVVNRDPAATEPAVHRFDVFALLELSALIKDCGAYVQVVTQDMVHQGFGERTEFCVGGPGSNHPVPPRLPTLDSMASGAKVTLISTGSGCCTGTHSASANSFIASARGPGSATGSPAP